MVSHGLSNAFSASFTMLGIIGMIDPAHVLNRVKMITGDYAATAVAIAAQINIGDSSVLSGEVLIE